MISIVRMKLLALLPGPSGIGLLSIFQSLQGMVAQVASLGIRSSGQRENTNDRCEEATLSRFRLVLFAVHFMQNCLAILAVWLMCEKIAT